MPAKLTGEAEMRKIAAVLAGLAIALTPLFATVSPANGTVHPANNIFNVNIQNNNGAGPITVTDKNGTLQNGAVVSGSAFTGNTNQHWDLVQNTSVCGDGFVHRTPGCPFVPGSGLNTLYNLDEVIRVCLHNNPGFCMAQQNNFGNVNLQSPNGTGTNWISDNGNHLVNRVVSDANGAGACLFNDGTMGDPLTNSTCGLSNARIGWEVNAF